MWSTALCTLGVTKPMNLCNCLSLQRQQHAGQAVLHFSESSISLLKISSDFDCLFSQESRGKRPLKIWDSWRNIRKGLVVGSFEELIVRGKYRNYFQSTFIHINQNRIFQQEKTNWAYLPRSLFDWYLRVMERKWRMENIFVHWLITQFCCS